jgi:hypothetical protein
MLAIYKRAVAQTKMSSSGSLSRSFQIHLGEAEDPRCQLFDPPQAESFGTRSEASALIAWSKPQMYQESAQNQGRRHLGNGP